MSQQTKPKGLHNKAAIPGGNHKALDIPEEERTATALRFESDEIKRRDIQMDAEIRKLEGIAANRKRFDPEQAGIAEDAPC